MTDTLVLDPRLDATVAPGLAEALSGIPSDADLVLDASKVTHLGALCLQVLLSARCSFRRGGGRLHINGLTGRGLDHLETMGLSPEFLNGASDDA